MLRDLCADILAAIGDTALAPAALSAALGPAPAAVEVTVTAPAGKRAEVTMMCGDANDSVWTVTEGQSQTWACVGSEIITVREGRPHSTVYSRRFDVV